MITAGLLVALLVAREVARAVDPGHPAVTALGRMLLPVAVGGAALLALRLVQVAT